MKKEKYLYGDLVQEEELNKAAKQRKKKYQEISVPNSEVPSFLRKRWQLKNQFKTTSRLRKKRIVVSYWKMRVGYFLRIWVLQK